MLLKMQRIEPANYVIPKQRRMNLTNNVFLNLRERNKEAEIIGREREVLCARKMTNSLIRFHPITLLCLSVVQNRPNLKKKILCPKKIVPAVLPSKIILSQTPPHKETILCIVDYQPITAVLPIAPSMTVMMYLLKASQAVDILVVADLPLQAGYQVPVPAVGVQVGQGRGTKEEGGERGVAHTIPYLDLGRGHMDPHVPGNE